MPRGIPTENTRANGPMAPVPMAERPRNDADSAGAAGRPSVQRRRSGRAPAIIFDVEGTLIDCAPQLLECWQGTLREFGHELSIPTLHPLLGLDTDDMLATLLPDVGEDEKRAIANAQGQRYRKQYLPFVGAFPGVRLVVERMRRAGYRIGLETSSQRDELAAYVHLAGLTGLFDAVACGSDKAMRGKPHPNLLSLVLRRLGRPIQAIHVGDTPYDGMAARHLGLSAVGTLTSGFRADELTRAGCDEVIGALPELLAVLRRMSASAEACP
jgi:phosphoglycolate phosphatase-like HAD superfamily hydrolase